MIYILILLIVLFSLIAYKLFTNKENFQSENAQTNTNTNTNTLEQLTKLLKHSGDVNKRGQFFDSVETTNKNLQKYTGKSGPNTDIPQKILDNYLEEYLKNTPNESLIDNNDKEDELPVMTNDNFKEYNHKLSVMNNKKKIRQDYIINLLKYKIKFLLETLKDVNEIDLLKTDE